MRFASFAFLALALSPAVSAKVLAVAAAVFSILQIVKKFVPGLGGVWAIAFNVALALIGFVITVPADQLFTLNTLVGLITAIAAAAGIHGTVKSMSA
jgi:hypothetical protein